MRRPVVRRRAASADDLQRGPALRRLRPPRLADLRAPFRRPLLALAVATAAASLVFVLFPQVDLAVTRRFHVAGSGFPATSDAILGSLRDLGQAATRMLVAVPLAALLVPLLFGGARFLMRSKDALFLLVATLLGPGLLVSVVLQGFWGRARPRDVADFGGAFDFSRAWVPSDACAWNCSFVSAESAAAMQLVAFAFVCPRPWRRTVAVVAVAFAVAVSLNRVAFGGHFLSDVVISWLLTLLVTLAVRRAFEAPAFPLTEEAITGWLGRTGERLRRAAGGS